MFKMILKHVSHLGEDLTHVLQCNFETASHCFSVSPLRDVSFDPSQFKYRSLSPQMDLYYKVLTVSIISHVVSKCPFLLISKFY